MPQPQILQIEPPHELAFKGPFTDVVTSQLKLTNPSDKQVCFKVKTTAPKQYCVRPNSGLIPANGTVNVAIMLQPFDYNPEDREKNKHKFMVQTAVVPEGETSLDNIWRNMTPEQLMDSKLRVHFELPEMNNVDRAAPTKQIPLKTAGGNEQTEAELRRQIDDNKRLQSKVHQLEQEYEQLRARLSRPDSAGAQHHGGGGSSQSLLAQQIGEFKVVHIVVALIVFFVGMLISKIF